MTKPSSTQDSPAEASAAASSKDPPATASSGPPSTSSLVALTALGLGSALWALFLWAELLLTRAGGEAFCDLGEGTDCVAVWDSGFASTIHDLTGLPVAGWGLVWSIAAALLPLWALKQRADGADASTAAGAVKLTAVAGVGAVVVFLIVSAGVGQLCLGCTVTYVAALAYAAVALGLWRKVSVASWQGAALRAVAVTLGAYLALLYPGLSTPKSAQSEAEAALAAVSASAAPGQDGAGASAPEAPADHGAGTAGAAHGGDPHAAGGSAAHGGDPHAAGGSAADQRLRLLMQQLPPQYLSLMAEAVRDYRAAPVITREPRALHGPADAPVRVTDFTDIQCPHCANLYLAFHELENQVPPGSFSVESRQFPLDGACNPLIGQKSEDPSLRCLAAKAQICLEGDQRAFEFTSTLFANQRDLTVDKVYELSAPYIDREQLDACVADPATQEKLQEDIAYAQQHGLEGTPLVLINGRKASAFPPFLFAMILTGGSVDHPAFESLPPPPPPGSNSHGHAH